MYIYMHIYIYIYISICIFLGIAFLPEQAFLLWVVFVPLYSFLCRLKYIIKRCAGLHGMVSSAVGAPCNVVSVCNRAGKLGVGYV